MDKTLLDAYAAAVQARAIVQQLPPGLREHALQFEQACLSDIRVQADNPNLTEQEVLNMDKPTLYDIAKQALPVVADLVITAIKKHYPTATIASVLSAAISYLMSATLK
jgi:hypothetical protein